MINFNKSPNYEIENLVDLYKQKFIDLFYSVEDSLHLHGVLPCHSYYKLCNNVASMMCSNYMCKLCCQDNQYKEFCKIHDTSIQFLRSK